MYANGKGNAKNTNILQNKSGKCLRINNNLLPLQRQSGMPVPKWASP